MIRLFLLSLFLAQPLLAQDRPNIVLIVSDDMGYSDLGCYGGEIATPNLDSLAENGLRYTNYYVNNMCVVTRASLMTGQYSGIALQGSLNRNCVTIPEALGQSDYTTLMSGKWHLGGVPGNQGSPNGRGFDHFYGTFLGAGSFFAPASLTRDDQNVEGEFADPAYYYTDAITNNALQFLEHAQDEKPEQPFFLYLAYTAAHWPLHARDEDIEPYKGKYAMGWDELRKERFARMKSMGLLPEGAELSPRNPEVPAWEDEEHKAWQERRMEVYAAQVTVMDANIGRLINYLKEQGEFDNTLILYHQDNGACHVEYGPNRAGDYLPEKTRTGGEMIPGNLPEVMPGPENTYQSYGYGWANAGNTPYRLYKQHDHEGGTRSPLIAHWPNGIKAKGEVDGTVSHVTDMLPTLLEVAGVEYPETFGEYEILNSPGRSFAATLKGGEVADREEMYWKNAHGRAARHGDWKLVGLKGQDWELYDLSKDATELNNLAEQMPEKVAELEKAWDAWDKVSNPRKGKKKKS